jgi:dihydrofolate reductase
MRTVTYGAACSLDGFIAAADGGMDWLHFSRDVQDIMAEYWATIDALIWGRKTWEFGGGPAKLPTYVCSRTLAEIHESGVQLVKSDAGEFVRALKRQPGKGICLMCGGGLARSLFEAGVIDEVRINIHPVLLGSGVPLFRDAGRIALEHIESRVIDGGCVLASYRVQSHGH